MRMDLKPGESITIGDIVVTLEAKSGQFSRLAIAAPKEVAISRVEHPASVPAIAAGGVARKPF